MFVCTWQVFDSQVKSDCHVGTDILPAGKMDGQLSFSSTGSTSPRGDGEFSAAEDRKEEFKNVGYAFADSNTKNKTETVRKRKLTPG